MTGEKAGKYPAGNRVIVIGADLRGEFDIPLVANRIGPAIDQVDLVVLSHVHENHVAGLHRLLQAHVQVHEADWAALQSWEGLARYFGYADNDDVWPTMKAVAELDLNIWVTSHHRAVLNERSVERRSISMHLDELIAEGGGILPDGRYQAV
ncbi:MBL fold metallo-hydrolase [Noviherbaspirillum sedimenti]|uniref:MBL fold metallo-hydrolase n=1 Tax=Noviherbaspirillum sedimenti TaxID=2320865 RepID=A0A3A3GK44_9BURK|nr:MBL fold metallo-hydrolase [Noviherbaspirillum sedimenti]RJG02676.1 MBL fold metallo-hydrolase [Noviherbaspirillum sedimenti]